MMLKNALLVGLVSRFCYCDPTLNYSIRTVMTRILFKLFNRTVTLLVMLCPLLVTAENKLSDDLEIVRSELSQGGYLLLKVSPGTQLKFLQRQVPVSDSGFAILGFGRDFEAQAKLTIIRSDKRYEKVFSIQPRQWEIEKIDGLPPSKVTPKSPETLARIAQESRLIRNARATNSKLEDFIAPFKAPAEGRISGVYGSQRVLNGIPKRPHFGQDIAAPVGTPVYAPVNGKVVLAHDDMFYSGATLILDHGNGLSSTYIHLNEISVKDGQRVQQGEQIGSIGQSGRATGPHLDWRINWFDQRLDPALFLSK